MADYEIVQSSVGAEQPIQIQATTRWDYLKKYMVLWQAMLAYELYQNVFLIIGVLALIAGSPLAILAFFISLYFRNRKMHRRQEVTSNRKVIVAH